MIQLKTITYENFQDVVDIYETLSESDKTHVAPNLRSIAEAYLTYDIAWPRAIMLEDELIGFIMMAQDNFMALEEDTPSYYLWRFMITPPHQNKGYGKQVLDMMVQKCKDENIRYLHVSCTRNDPMPYDMYIKYGFEDTGRVEDGEQVLKLSIQ